MIRHNNVAIWLMVFFNFLLLILWYSPLMFYYPWSNDLGFNQPGFRPKDNLPYVTVVVSFIAMNYTISWLVQVLNKDSWKKGAKFGLLLFFGLAAPLMASRYKPLDISTKVLFIDMGFVLVVMMVNTMILAVWRKNESGTGFFG